MGLLALLLPILALSPWLALATRHYPGRDRVLLVAGSCVLGIGSSSIASMWLLASGMPIDRSIVPIDAALWLVVGAAGAWCFRNRRPVASAPPAAAAADRPTGALWLARLAFAVTAALALATAVREYGLSPHGEWDAWAVWNQKARFLFRGGERWVDQLSIPWSNPSHPLLLPITVARMWSYAASEATLLPAVLAALCGALSVGLVMSALDLGRARAWIAGAAMLAPAMFVQQVMTQQADVPAATFMTASTVLLLAARRSLITPHAHAGLLFLLSGLFAGYATWAKNEGLMFTAAAGAAVLLTVARHRPLRNLAWWLAGLAPGLLTTAWFKSFIAPVPPPYFEASQVPWATFVGERAQGAGSVVWVMIQEAFRWGGPGAMGAVPAALAVAIVAARRDPRARLGLLIYALMTLGFAAVFLATPLDSAWLARTTYYRLLTQLWPILVLVAFLVWSHDDHAGVDHKDHEEHIRSS